MANTKIYIVAGIETDKYGDATGSVKFYITAGLPKQKVTVSSSSSSRSSSSSSQSSSSSSQSSSSSSLLGYSSSSSVSSSSSSASVWGYIWGASSPPSNYVDKVWGLWKLKESATEARNTGDDGNLLVATSEEFVSDVIDFGSSEIRYLQIDTTDSKGTGGIEWRGSDDTAFNQDDNEDSVAWESYSRGNKTWRYIQIKVSCS